jgi:hypothetical protein
MRHYSKNNTAKSAGGLPRKARPDFKLLYCPAVRKVIIKS